MDTWKPLSPSLLSVLAQLLPPSDCCDLTVGNRWLWREHLSVCLSAAEDFACLRLRLMDGREAFYPLTPTDPAPTARLLGVCETEGIPLRLFPLTDAQKDALLRAYPRAVAESAQAQADYLYDAEALATYKGRRYNGQRNHLNRFRAAYPEARLRAVESRDREGLLRLLGECYELSPPLHPALAAERERLLLQAGGEEPWAGTPLVLAEGDLLFGLSVGELVGEVAYIHTEKVPRRYGGAHQALVQATAAYYRERGARRINREEDDGNAGLRRAKQALHPTSLARKWVVTVPTEQASPASVEREA